MKAALAFFLLLCSCPAAAQTQHKLYSRAANKPGAAGRAQTVNSAKTQPAKPAPPPTFAFSEVSNSIKLEWHYGSLDSIYFFKVERSNDDSTYTELVRVTPVFGQYEYRYLDEDVVESQEYHYRISSVAPDSSYRYSNTISFITKPHTSSGMNIVADTAAQTVIITGTTPVGVPFGVQLTEEFGRPIESMDDAVPGMPFRREINAKNLPAGIYFIYVGTEKDFEIFRVVKR